MGATVVIVFGDVGVLGLGICPCFILVYSSQQVDKASMLEEAIEYLKALQMQVQDNFFASFLLGWGITIGAGLASYPIDTVCRRMMMTSGEAVKYRSSLDAFSQIMKNEGAKYLFKGAGANILRAVAGAGVLAGYDKLQVLVLGKKYGSGGGG